MSEMFKIKNGIGLKPKNLATIVNPAAGDVACDESDNKIKFYDVSTSTWKEMRAVDSVNGQTGTVVLTKSDVGLSNVDNTSDANKPISTATQAALDNIKQDLDIYYEQDMERLANTTDFSKGNNAAFMGGGTLQGTLSLEEVAPISGTKSLKYVQAVGSVNDYFASPVIDLDLKQKNNTSAMTFYFEYDGNDNDGRFVVYDVTNSIEIASEVSFVKVANKATRYSISFYVPADSNQIRWGYKVLVENTGKALIVDDVELSMNPFQAKELSNSTELEPMGLTASDFQGFGTPAGVELTSCARDGEFLLMFGSFSSGTPTATQARINLKYKGQSLTVKLPNNPTYASAGTWFRGTSAAFSGSILINHGQQYIKFGVQSTGGSGVIAANGTDITTTGNQIVFNARIPIAEWSATTSNILLPSDTFSSDSAPLTYASSSQYNLTTLANAPIGTYITFTYAANTNTRTQTTTRPTQTDASMNVNGMQIFTRLYNAASTAASPTAFAINIGKGLKGQQLNIYKSSGKVTSGSLDHTYIGTNTEFGLRFKEYNESTGIILIDAGIRASTTISAAHIVYSDLTSDSNGYLTINAGRTLPLLAVPTPLVAYLKDVKPSGTAGGTFTAGAWQTRTLNTIEGDASIVSLSANQFVLSSGKYEIEASAPSYGVDNTQLKLRNITSSTDSIIGTSEQTDSSATRSSILGTIVLTSTSTFELQHRCATTRATQGLGVDASLGVSEVYTTLKIKKIG